MSWKSIFFICVARINLQSFFPVSGVVHRILTLTYVELLPYDTPLFLYIGYITECIDLYGSFLNLTGSPECCIGVFISMWYKERKASLVQDFKIVLFSQSFKKYFAAKKSAFNVNIWMNKSSLNSHWLYLFWLKLLVRSPFCFKVTTSNYQNCDTIAKTIRKCFKSEWYLRHNMSEFVNFNELIFCLSLIDDMFRSLLLI